MHFMGDDDHGDAEGRDGGDGIQNFPYEFGIEREVGSSKRMTSGFGARALAIPTRCCMPPESSDGYMRA